MASSRKQNPDAWAPEELRNYIRKNEPALKEIMIFPQEGFTMHDYLLFMADRHPDVFRNIRFNESALDEWRRMYDELNALATHSKFGEGGDPKKNRGDAYRRMREDPKYTATRRTGERELFQQLIGAKDNTGVDTRKQLEKAARVFEKNIFIDGLGGNGTLARALQALTGDVPGRKKKKYYPKFITSDIDPAMICSALFDHGLPAVRQFMTSPLLANQCAAGVIYAYGTHHIPIENMPTTLASTHQLLKPGGICVVHDFQEDTPSAQWYSKIIADYSLTGHHVLDAAGRRLKPMPHYDPDTLHKWMKDAGFEGKVVAMYDPFILEGETKEAVRREMLAYLVEMFGLEKLKPGCKEADPEFRRRFGDIAKDYASYSDFVHDTVIAHPHKIGKRPEIEKDYWNYVESVMEPTSRVDLAYMKKMNVHVANPLLLRDRLDYLRKPDGSWMAIMPRMALVAVGKVPLRVSARVGEYKGPGGRS